MTPAAPQITRNNTHAHMPTTTTTQIYNNEELATFLDSIHKKIDISCDDKLVVEMSAPYGDPYVIDVRVTAVPDIHANVDERVEQFIAKYGLVKKRPPIDWIMLLPLLAFLNIFFQLWLRS